MADPRIGKLAEVLVDYSTKVKKGDTVLIHAIGMDTIPFVKALHKLALQRGAKMVEYKFFVPEIDKDFYIHGKPAQIDLFPKHEMDFMKQVDVFIGVRAPENSMVMANADQKKVTNRMRVIHPILEQRVNKTRWVVTRWPTHTGAQDAKMSLEDFEDFFFSSTIFDYAGLKEKQKKLVTLLNRTKTIKIRSTDTDLSFSLKGMKSVSCHGDRNIPDGEVYTAPVRNSVEGYITYNAPSIYMGKEFDGVRFEFKKGKIIKATCPGLDKELNKILDTDDGSRYIGEFAIGTNTQITKPARNILFDEKIFGSIHFTPGMAYEDCDNGNKSAVHWDLVKILTGDGELWFDNKIVQRDGIFIHPMLKPLNPKSSAKAAKPKEAKAKAKPKAKTAKKK
jgi:aminopeptidase